MLERQLREILSEQGVVLESDPQVAVEHIEVVKDRTTRLVDYLYSRLLDRSAFCGAFLGGGYAGYISYNFPAINENPLVNLVAKSFVVSSSVVGGGAIGAAGGLIGIVTLGAMVSEWRNLAGKANKYIL